MSQIEANELLVNLFLSAVLTWLIVCDDTRSPDRGGADAVQPSDTPGTARLAASEVATPVPRAASGTCARESVHVGVARHSKISLNSSRGIIWKHNPPLPRRTTERELCFRTVNVEGAKNGTASKIRYGSREGQASKRNKKRGRKAAICQRAAKEPIRHRTPLLETTCQSVGIEMPTRFVDTLFTTKTYLLRWLIYLGPISAWVDPHVYLRTLHSLPGSRRRSPECRTHRRCTIGLVASRKRTLIQSFVVSAAELNTRVPPPDDVADEACYCTEY